MGICLRATAHLVAHRIASHDVTCCAIQANAPRFTYLLTYKSRDGGGDILATSRDVISIHA